MTAEEYKLITGLENWEGFKQQLKVSGFGSRYDCQDDTILFNCIKTGFQSSFGGAVSLNANQVAVVLNLNSPTNTRTVGTTAVVQTDTFRVRALDGTDVDLDPLQLIKGFPFTTSYKATNVVGTGVAYSFAIFDLF